MSPGGTFDAACDYGLAVTAVLHGFLGVVNIVDHGWSYHGVSSIALCVFVLELVAWRRGWMP